MKHTITVFVLFLAALAANGQTAQDTTTRRANVTIDANGNYKAITTTRTRTAAAPIETGQTYTDKTGNVSPVYKTKSGKLYTMRTSKKTGKEYRYYLRTE